MDRETLERELKYLVRCGEASQRTLRLYLNEHRMEDLKSSNWWDREAKEGIEKIMEHFDQVENGMVVGAEEEYDYKHAREERRENKIEEYMDSVEWHDVAGWTDAEDDLARILFLLDNGRSDEALDLKESLKERWATWAVDNE